MCKCPKCNTKLIIEDVTDTQTYIDVYIERGYGYCPKCKTKYFIDTFYNFIHYEIEEMEED